MKRLPLIAALALGLALPSIPAPARDFVQDQAGMFSAATVSQLNTTIGNFNAQTGKEVVVVTAPSLGGKTLQVAGNDAFAQQNVNGVLIYIAKAERKDIIVPDRAGLRAGWFTPGVTATIRHAMETQFKDGNYDAGIAGAVDAILNVYRSHLGTLHAGASNGAGSNAAPPISTGSSSVPLSGGFNFSAMIVWIIIAIVAFLVIRAIFRAFAGPRYYGPTGGGMPPGYGPGYGPPGYGYGGGGWGGGGGFMSGLLGGLGGAWLGNELFGQHGGFTGPADAAQQGGDAGNWSGGADNSGWQSDAGQAGMGGSSGGDWGGGGFGDTGGGGGFDGGGGGFDGGGGGGDSGGGW